MDKCSIVLSVICIIGFSWQVFKVCDLYFKYNVVSVISIKLPEKEYPKGLNVCVQSSSVANQTRVKVLLGELQKILPSKDTYFFNDWSPEVRMVEYLSSKQLLYMTLDPHELFPMIPRGDDFMKYVIGKRTCYQVSNDVEASIDPYVKVKRSSWPSRLDRPQVTTYISSLGKGLCSARPLVALTEIGDVLSQKLFLSYMPDDRYIDLSSHYVEMNKLLPPYTDGCHEYKLPNQSYRSRNIAIDECVNNFVIQIYNISSSMMFHFTGDDHIESIYPSSDIVDRCEQKYWRDNCHTQQHIVEYYNQRQKYSCKLIINVLFGDKASYVIDSAALMDDIDFVTYIFGALGTWFGFSFLMCNPMNIMFKGVDTKIEPETVDEQVATIQDCCDDPTVNAAQINNWNHINHSINIFCHAFQKDAEEFGEQLTSLHDLLSSNQPSEKIQSS